MRRQGVGTLVVMASIGVLLLVFGVSPARAGTYRCVYEFSEPTIKVLRNGAVIVELEDAWQNDTVVGAPILPARTGRLFIPSDEEVVSVTVSHEEAVSIPGEYVVQYAYRPYPLSYPGAIFPDYPNTEIHTKNSDYPGQVYTYQGTQYLHGYQIAIIDLMPVAYNPVNYQIQCYEQMEVVVETAWRIKPAGVLSSRSLAADWNQVLRLVDNKVDFVRLNQASNFWTYDQSREYVVITPEEFVPILQRLTDFRETFQGGGFSTHIETIENIDVFYAGVDRAEKVRKFIRDCYTRYGTRYVVLGGDCDGLPKTQVIPSRGVVAYGPGWELNIPSDLYYGCLDGTWNNDGDNRWGEGVDGIDGGDIDWYSEVYVGRIAADTPAEAGNHIAKILAFEQNGVRISQSLLVGEGLDTLPTWGADKVEWIQESMDSLGNTKLYDRDSPGNNWSTSQVLDLINSNEYAWINHIGRSSVNTNLKIENNAVANMANSVPFLLYSQGCYSGSIDNRDAFGAYSTEDSFGEVVTNGYHDRGAFAYIGNARYGLYIPGNYPYGMSNYAHKKFVDAFLVDNHYRLGEANQFSRSQLPVSGWYAGPYRWIAFELNLLGDPATPLYLEEFREPPIAQFRADPLIGDEPHAVQFNNTSVGASQWIWDFGDGTMSTEQHPLHTYDTEGKYTVTLAVLNAHGSDVRSTPDYIRVGGCGIPKADFETPLVIGQAPFTVSFVDMSENATTWMWSFGDWFSWENISFEQNPTHTYEHPGTYPVTLTVFNNCGESDWVLKHGYITVKKDCPPVDARFTASPLAGEAPLTIQFIDKSEGAAGWLWNFGDPDSGDDNYATSQHPYHTYRNPGIYSVTLIMYNECGGMDMAMHVASITVMPRGCITPVPDFSASPLTGEAPLAVSFTDLSTGADGWMWYFGDLLSGENYSSEQNPTHTYTRPGWYTVTLGTYNGCGETQWHTKPFYINASKLQEPAPDPQPQPCTLPDAAFGADPEDGKVPLEVIFTNNSKNEDSWHWDFGDGSTSNERSPTYVYEVPGTYTVILTVENACGTGTRTRKDVITAKSVNTGNVTCDTPISSFSASPTSGTGPLNVSFNDRSSGSTSWQWNFGDGTASTNQSPTHRYTASGTYTVTLQVTSSCGSDTTTKTDYITVNEPPQNVMHINAIEVTRLPGMHARGQARVQIVGNGGAPVAGATIRGEWTSGAWNDNTMSTDASGWATCTSNLSQMPRPTFTFCVIDVAKSGWSYHVSSNVLECGSS